MGPLGDYLKKYGVRLLMFLAGLVIVGWQFVYSLNMDVAQYMDTLNREKNNPSLNFYSALDHNDLSRLTLDRQLVVFRDVAMYVPNSANDKVYYQWGVSGYADIHKFNADLLVLSKQHLYDLHPARPDRGGSEFFRCGSPLQGCTGRKGSRVHVDLSGCFWHGLSQHAFGGRVPFNTLIGRMFYVECYGCCHCGCDSYADWFTGRRARSCSS